MVAWIWDGSPIMFSLDVGNFHPSLRWYGVLFALGFLVSQQVMVYIFKKEGNPASDVDSLTMYMVIATIVGARLGHVLFYEPHLVWDNPIAVLLPISIHPFEFTGFLGLASHGAAIGVLLAIGLFVRSKKPTYTYLFIVDRIVLVAALIGAFIRMGNYFNSEIIGKPYHGPTSVVFINPLSEALLERIENSSVQKIEYTHNQKQTDKNYEPLLMSLYFKDDVTPPQATEFIENEVRFIASQIDLFVHQPYNAPLPYHVEQKNTGVVGTVELLGVPRHPAQLYESISCLLLFGFLLWIWNKKREKTQPGLIFGWFMTVLWTLRFFYEFLKENQVEFEEKMNLNMGQILSIPMVLIGLYFIYTAYFKNKTESQRESH